MTTKTTLLSMLSVVFLAAAPASAQIDIDNARVEIFGGGSLMNAERLFTINDSFRSEFDSGGKFGFRVITDITEGWGAEASYGLASNGLQITPLERPGLDDRTFDMRVHQFVGNLMYSFGDVGGTRPFVTAGIGLSRFSPTSEAERMALVEGFIEQEVAIDSENKFNFNFGGGVEGVITDRIGYRVNVRDHVTGIPRFGLSSTPAGNSPVFPVTGSMHNVELTAGLVINIFRR